MPKLEEAKQDLESTLKMAKDKAQKEKESTMSEEERKALETKKAEDAKKAEEVRLEAERKAKEDAEILAKKDEELDEAGKKRKAELEEAKLKEEEKKLGEGEKVKRIADKMQKRIDELTNRLKETEDKSSKEAKALKLEIETLRKEKEKPQEKSLEEIADEEEAKLRSDYLIKDKSLPREKRRELDDETLDEWLLEDQKSAVAWIQRREIRRMVDRKKLLDEKQQTSMSKKLLGQQIISFNKVKIKHPDLDVSKRRAELKSQGKTDEEVESLLIAENKKYALMLKIADEHPEWKTDPEAPELAMEEMETRLSSNENNNSEVERLKEQILALENKISQMENNDEGIPPSPKPRTPKAGEYTPQEKELIDTMKSAGATQAMIDSAIEKHRKKK